LSEAVLQMQESGEISVLKIKWWKEKRGGGACTAAAEEGGAEELTVANVGGVFVVLIVGGVVAIVVCLFEMLFDVRNRAMEVGVSLLLFSFFSRLFKTFFNQFLASICTRTYFRVEIYFTVQRNYKNRQPQES
jgi:hypothetical protein